MKSKKVLSVNTLFYRLMGGHYNELPLENLTIATVLREGGHEVEVSSPDDENRGDYLNQRGISNMNPERMIGEYLCPLFYRLISTKI